MKATLLLLIALSANARSLMGNSRRSLLENDTLDDELIEE